MSDVLQLLGGVLWIINNSLSLWDFPGFLGKSFFRFIGNSDVGEHKKKHMFTEHMLDKRVFGHDDRTKEMLEDIKIFDIRFVSK